MTSGLFGAGSLIIDDYPTPYDEYLMILNDWEEFERNLKLSSIKPVPYWKQLKAENSKARTPRR